jgi:hypothetical protein
LITTYLVAATTEFVITKPHESTLWENWVIATMAITRGKYVFSHISPCIHCAWAALSIFFISSKRHESWTHVTFLPGFGLSFDHKKTTEIHNDLSRSPQQWRKTHNHVSHAMCLEYYVGTCKNNTNLKIILAYNFRQKRW